MKPGALPSMTASRASRLGSVYTADGTSGGTSGAPAPKSGMMSIHEDKLIQIQNHPASVGQAVLLRITGQSLQLIRLRIACQRLAERRLHLALDIARHPLD